MHALPNAAERVRGGKFLNEGISRDRKCLFASKHSSNSAGLLASPIRVSIMICPRRLCTCKAARSRRRQPAPPLGEMRWMGQKANGRSPAW